MNTLLVMNESENINALSTVVIPNGKNFIKYFLELKALKSTNTSDNYERDIKDFFKVSNIEDITMDNIIDVTILDAENFIMELQNKGYSSATVNRKVSSLSALYRWLQKYSDNRTNFQLVKFNPFSNLKEEKPVINNKDTEFLTKDESVTLMNSIDTNTILGLRNKAIISLILTTGLRKSEVINIKLQDVTTVNGYDVIKVVRKGNKNDMVKLQAPVRNMIEEYIQRTGRNKGDNAEDYLFIGHSTNGLNKGKLDRSTLNYMIKAVCKRVGINKELTVHGCRHSAITMVIMAGATAEKARDFAAHKSIATTNRYIHSVDKLKNSGTDLISIF